MKKKVQFLLKLIGNKLSIAVFMVFYVKLSSEIQYNVKCIHKIHENSLE